MFCCEIWDWDGLVEVRDVPYRYDTWPPWKLMMCKGVPRFILVITRDLILQTRQSYFTIYSQRKMLLGVWSRARWCDRENQFSSVAQSRPTLCDPMNHSTPGLPVHHQLPEFTQTHAHGVSDAIQASHPLSLLQDGLVGSSCSPRDSQESSPTPQFKSINSSALSSLHSPTLTSMWPLEKP